MRDLSPKGNSIMRQTHPIPPIFGNESNTLILGSFPSVKSREAGFFYGHPQNRFWRVLAEIFNTEIPKNVEQKKALVLSGKLALWDVIASCEIVGSSDTSISSAVPNDLSVITEHCDIKRIFVNGKTAEKYYNKYQLEKTGIPCTALPSTSPANAAYNLQKLCECWKIIL